MVMRCGMNGVVHGEYGAVKCIIPSDVEWFDAVLDMV